MPMNLENSRALYARVEQATDNPGEHRHVQCPEKLNKWQCERGAGHEGAHELRVPGSVVSWVNV